MGTPTPAKLNMLPAAVEKRTLREARALAWEAIGYIDGLMAPGDIEAAHDKLLEAAAAIKPLLATPPKAKKGKKA